MASFAAFVTQHDHRYLKITACKRGTKGPERYATNLTAIYLDVGEPFTIPCFNTCYGNKSEDNKSLPLP